MLVKEGDILVQIKGEPWRWAANFFTGAPYPHACLVSKVRGDDFWIIENSTMGISERKWENPDMRFTYPLDHYEIWRPKCSDIIKVKAIDWARDRMGESYGYWKLLFIGLTYRFWKTKEVPGMDDDLSLDRRQKVCSETIAMGYYRNGYDVAPHVSDKLTMPSDLRNKEASDLIDQL